VATLAHFCQRPLAYIVVPENLRPEGGLEIDSAASVGEKTPRERERERERDRERKLSGRQKSAEEIPSRRGEIAAIIDGAVMMSSW
jgi:hypothetical protein